MIPQRLREALTVEEASVGVVAVDEDDWGRSLEARGAPVDGRAPVLLRVGRVDVYANLVDAARRLSARRAALRELHLLDGYLERVQNPLVVLAREEAYGFAVKRNAVALGRDAGDGRARVHVE